MTDTLLFIEDDRPFCELAEFALTRKGFQVEIAHDALTGLKKASTLHPDAVILDVMLPDLDGWQTCVRLRAISDVPIIMLTALGSIEDTVKGLDLGADAYLVKPVTTEELSARIRAVLQRATRSRIREDSYSDNVFRHDHLVVDLERQQVTVSGQEVELSPAELRLLMILIQHKGQSLSYEFLLREVWGQEFVDEVDYLRLYISHLRRKLKDNPSKSGLIRNEWGVGYRFA